MTNQSEFFYCYSLLLFRYLKANGERYVCTGLHPKTMRQFWQFERTDRLNALIDDFNEKRAIYDD